jgi:hypothetical protein
MSGERVNIRFRFDQQSLVDVHAMLSELPQKMRGKVLRGALRRTLKRQLTASRAAARPQDVRTRRDIAIKTKTYKRGRVIWASVGVLFDAAGTRRDSTRQGWRAHFHDVGYRPWRKGVKADGTAPKVPRGDAPRNRNARFAPFIRFNKGWRLGKKGRNLGGRILRTGFLFAPARAFEPQIIRAVQSEVEQQVKESNSGR